MTTIVITQHSFNSAQYTNNVLRFLTDLNLIDWSSFNILAVALGTSVYLWNADTGAIDQLLELEGANYVTSLNWVPNGNLLSVGISTGRVHVCSISHIGLSTH